MDRSSALTVRASVRLDASVKFRLVNSWRPTVVPADASVGAVQFGVVFAGGPDRAVGNDEFVAELCLLAWPDPVTSWFYRAGVGFKILEGETVVGLGRVEDVLAGA